MTAARLKAAPADGHGLTSSLCDSIYSKRQRGEPTGDVVVIAVLRPVGTFERDTARGSHKGVHFEAIRCEPIRAAGGLVSPDQLRAIAEEAFQARTSHGVRTLPLDFEDLSVEERRKELIEAIEAWAATEGLTGKEVDERWRDLLGSGDNAAGSYEKGSLQHLLQFATTVDAIGEAVEENEETEPGTDSEAQGPEPEAVAS